MEKKEYEPPITVSEADGKITISYDQTEVSIPENGPVPIGTPPLACRIFNALKCDLPGLLRAEKAPWPHSTGVAPWILAGNSTSGRFLAAT